MKLPCRAAFLTAILAPATMAQQGAGELEEVLVFGQLSPYSALKSAIPIMETARSVSIESHRQIIDKGALVLDDTFTYSAGVIGETYGFATRGDWIKVRGLDVPLYQDSLQSLFGNYNNTRPDIYTLEQVEILKGPASVLFGKGSPGGLVNVISKRPREAGEHELALDLGNFERRQLALDSTGPLTADGQWLYRAVGLYRDSATQVDHVDDDAIVFAPSVSWRPSDRTDITLLLNYRDTESDTAAQFMPIAGSLEQAPNGARFDSKGYFGEPGFNRYDARTTAVSLLAEHRFNDVWSMQFTSRYTDAEADYRQAWPAFIGGDRYVYNPDGTLYGDGTVPRTFYRSDATSEQAAADVRLRADFRTGALEHAILLGTQYQDVTTGDAGYYLFALGYDGEPGDPADAQFGDAYWINLFDPRYGNVPPAEVLDAAYARSPDTDSRDFGLYASDEISLGNWRLTLGLRFDATETTTAAETQDDDAISTGFGVLYQFENGMAPYASYAESFEPVVGDDGRGQALDPQEGEQLELGIKYQPAHFPARVTLAWFDLEQSNLPDPLARPGEFEQQSGVSTIQGMELEALAQLGDITLEFNASLLDTEGPDGWRLASVPEEQASAWTTWRPQGPLAGFRAGAGVRYVGASWDGVDGLKTPSYTLYDLMLGWGSRHWDLALNVRNLTDEDYFATCLARGDCFVGDERTVVARLSYLF